MSGGLTGRAATAALDYLTGRKLDLGLAPQTMQIALLTAAPPTNPTLGQVNEVASPGYTRQNVTWFSAVNDTPGQPSWIGNSANILYGPFTDVGGLAYPATHCALIGTGVPASTANLLSANASDIETDASGWINFGNSTIARSTTQFKTGAASLAQTSVAVGNMTAGATARVSVTPFTTYTGTAWVYAPVSLGTKLDMLWEDSTPSQVAYSASSYTTVPATTWTQISYAFKAPAAAATVKLVVSANSTVAGQVVYWDSMTLAASATQDILMTWQFDVIGQAAQNESLQISSSQLSMLLG